MAETPDSGSVTTNGKNHDIRVEDSKLGIGILIIEEASLCHARHGNVSLASCTSDSWGIEFGCLVMLGKLILAR